MNVIKSGDFIGYSNEGISEAVQNALEKAGEPARFEVVEMVYSHEGDNQRQYQVTLATLSDQTIS